MSLSQTSLIHDPQNHGRTRIVSTWLMACALMIFMMAIIGAITRLTESGLSITEWRPITGVLLPSGEAAWQAAFDLYRASPEYIHKNAGMTMAEFQYIYFWEWFHRLWGRFIGLVYAVPLILFWMRGWFTAPMKRLLLGLLVLGGLQGVMGWVMVQSGLVDRPSVSPYRLAMHLSLAFILYAALIALAVRVRYGPRVMPPLPHGFRPHLMVGTVLLGVTIIWGALVAGLDAGLIYNEFPTMGPGRLIPPEMWHQSPWWINLFENHASVQFVHRWLAVITALVILTYAVRGMISDRLSWIYPALGLMVLVQVGLGIATLLSGLNIVLAVMHQAGAMGLIAAFVLAWRDVNARVYS